MKRYDFIVGFTTFYPGGFKTRYQHFDDLKVAKMFANNKNLKNTSKIYVDLEYYEELENINKQNIQEIKELKHIIDIFQEKINIELKGNEENGK